MSADLVFYTNPMSRGQIIRWMLEEVGEEYQTEVLEYGAPLTSPEYLAINPMGKLPAIVHNGKVVTECAAICAYLAAVFPSADLGPAPGQEADYFRWLFFAAGPLESAITNQTLGWVPNDEQQRMAGYGNYDLTMSTLSEFLADRPYVCGSKFTAADVYLGSHIDFGIQFGSISNPADSLVAYIEPLRKRAAYITAKAKDTALMPQE